MKQSAKLKSQKKPAGHPNLFSILKPYGKMIFALVLLALLSNGLNLAVPKIISHGIDGFLRRDTSQSHILWQFFVIAVFIFIFVYLQSIFQTIVSEKVGRDMRNQLSAKIAKQSYSFVQKITPTKLLTNLTSDIDSVKMFVSQAIVNIASSVFIILGASILLININWRLGLAVIAIVPAIAITFFVILSKVRVLFRKTREVIDRLNKVINESILGSALIRVLNSQQPEYDKFIEVNSDAQDLGLKI